VLAREILRSACDENEPGIIVDRILFVRCATRRRFAGVGTQNREVIRLALSPNKNCFSANRLFDPARGSTALASSRGKSLELFARLPICRGCGEAGQRWLCCNRAS